VVRRAVERRRDGVVDRFVSAAMAVNRDRQGKRRVAPSIALVAIRILGAII
jgi:hypothetical protein